MRYRLLIIALTIVAACGNFGRKEEKPSQEIEFTLTADNERVNDAKIKIVAVYDSLDTVEFKSIDKKIKLPLYNSRMTFFGIRYMDYKSEFSGDFLKFELPTINDATIKTWYIDVDNPPFAQNYKDSSLTYVFQIATDENKTNQVWTYGRD